MKLLRSIGFYILSVYLVSESTSFILKKFKLCKACNRPRRPNSPTSSGLSPALCFPGNDAQKWTNADLDKINKKMTDARRDFAFDALKVAFRMKPNDNLFFSPHSIHQAITLVYFGALGTTESSLKKTLHIPKKFSKAHVQRFYEHEKTLHQRRKEQGKEPAGYEYNSANRLWISKEKNIRKCMLDLFSNELEKTDFRADPTAARNRINEWVSNTTKGHIKDLIPTGGVTADTDLVLANAVHFKGLWASPFNKTSSERKLFYGSNNEVTNITYMVQIGIFPCTWSKDLQANILELPYTSDNVSMFILLPYMNETTHDSNLSQLIDDITKKEGVQELVGYLKNGMNKLQVELSLPRFSIEGELQMAPLLHVLGAGELVTADKADLRGFLADGEENLHLGDAVHRATVDVNEEGTTAAAATGILDARVGLIHFKADHPFVYMIYDRPNESILFIGAFKQNPNE